MSLDQDTIRTHVEETLGQNDFLQWLGVGVEAVGPDFLRLSVPGDDRHLTRSGRVQGGVAATLIDVAGAMVQRTACEDAADLEALTTPTINLNVTYLRPATGGIVAEASVVRAGGTIGVSYVTVTEVGDDAETEGEDRSGERPLATGTTTHFLTTV